MVVDPVCRMEVDEKWRCTDQGCSIVPSTNTPPAFVSCPVATGYGAASDLLVYICTGIAPVKAWACGDCRAVACSSTADCPQFQGKAYGCRNGLCEDTALADAGTLTDLGCMALVSLCDATSPRAASCDPNAPEEAAANALIAQQCLASGCVLPATCRQP